MIDMGNRRDFCKQLGALGLAAATPGVLLAGGGEARQRVNEERMMWAYLIHLSFNMWEDYLPEGYDVKGYPPGCTDKEATEWAHGFHPDLTCETEVWDRVIRRMADSGANTVVIDLGDGVRYDSHPEIAVKGAWTPKQLKRALERMRGLGIEPIPKLNFSTAHKAWLHDYQYMVSSKPYYRFCGDLIDEVCDLFGNPRFFHLGMDEETCDHQTYYHYSVVRRGDVWWKDFYYLVDRVERNNVRAWVWSDNIWRDREEFLRRMPKGVLQSNWVYEEQNLMFNERNEPNDVLAQGFIDLEANGYDQVPTGSLWLNGNWDNYGNFDRVVMHNRRIVAPERLKGFMQTIWMPTLKPCLDTHYRAIDLIGEARGRYY